MKEFKSLKPAILFFCIIAAVRVAVYSAAFPFFNNVDEEAHFDLVIKYNQGHIPRCMENYSPVSANYISRFCSYEYTFLPSYFRENKLPAPLWKSSKEEAHRRYKERFTFWKRVANYESTHAPLYYALAASWLKLGQITGVVNIKEGLLLYWIRFLNIFLAIGLVIIAYKSAIAVFPGNRLMHICVPMFVAIFPQDSYYSIQSDVLSPFCYGLTFLSMIHFIRSDIPTRKEALFVGISLTLTVLVKISNLPVLAVVLGSVGVKTYHLIIARKFREFKSSFYVFALSALVPICSWFLWNLSVYGDIAASADKIQIFGWTKMPIGQWFNNSLFTAHGAIDFWSELMASFWRGEFVWIQLRLSSPTADAFYWASSLVFVLIAMINISRSKDRIQQHINYFTAFSFISVIIFMILLSISFDFNESVYPSRERPYFTSGRLMSAAFIPFLLLYIRGFDKMFCWIKNEKIRIAILALIGIIITLSEFLINKEVFSSNFNLFSLPN